MNKDEWIYWLQTKIQRYYNQRNPSKWIAIRWGAFVKKRTLKVGFSISGLSEMMPQGYNVLQAIPWLDSGITLASYGG